MRKKRLGFFNRYYNKLMLINTGIICVVTLVFGIIASKNALTYERMMLLRPYEDTLNQLHANYYAKQENFASLMLTFYESGHNFQTITTLLENPESELSSLDAFDLRDITVLLNVLSNKDHDIHSIFVYKGNTQSLYAYSPTSSVLKQLDDNSPFYKELSNKDYRRTIHAARNLSFLESDTRPVYAYGIGGNLSSANNSMISQPGNIMVAYNFNGLIRTLQNKGLEYSGRFLILTLDGKIIFDSKKMLSTSIDGTYFPHVEHLSNDNSTIDIDGEKYYTSMITDEKRGYVTTYLVPKSVVDKFSNYFSVIIFIGSIGFIALSIFVYLLASRLSSKRVGMIEVAMHEIGANNLSYRIPVSRQDDEFTFISSRFNDMCDELEDKINKAYIYELKQKSSELYALQSSINPHFLYNTLEAIRGRLVQDGNSDAAEMVVLLSKLYRNQIKGKMFIHLREEINHCNMYLELFSIRYDNNFNCHFQLDNDMMKYGIPKNTIQPILENYLVHGIKEQDNSLSINGTLSGNVIEITIQDNGRGINPQQLAEIQENLLKTRETSDSGFGLSNVNDRLKIVYGNGFGLSIDKVPDRPGTIVTIKIAALSVEQMEQQYYANKRGIVHV